MVSLVFNSPSPKTLMGSVARRMKPCARSSSGVTVSPAGNTFSSSRFTTEYETPNGLWKPRFGIRRCNGICPPSNPRRREYPRRDFCPLLPLPAVLPSFEPIPRPTRTLRLREPLGGCKFESVYAVFGLLDFVEALRPPEAFFAIALLHHFHEMPHLVDHAANGRRVFALDNLVHAAQTEAANALAHVIGAADKTDDPLDLHFAAGIFADALYAGFSYFCAGHQLLSPAAALCERPLISSTVLERVSATWATSFRPSSAANVALTTLCGLDVPR